MFNRKRSFFLILFILTIGAALMATQAFGQARDRTFSKEGVWNDDTRNEEGAVTDGDQHLGMTESVNDVIGSEVRSMDGENLGVVQDVLFTDDGRPGYLVINESGVIGGSDQIVPIPVSAAQPAHFEQGTYVISIDSNTFDDAPRFTSGELAAFSGTDWRQEVRGYYGADEEMEQEVDMERSLTRSKEAGKRVEPVPNETGMTVREPEIDRSIRTSKEAGQRIEPNEMNMGYDYGNGEYDIEQSLERSKERGRITEPVE